MRDRDFERDRTHTPAALLFRPAGVVKNKKMRRKNEKNEEKENAKIYFNNVLKLDLRKDFMLEDLDFKARAVLSLQKL